MIGDLDHAVAIQRKSVVAGGRNVCAENRKTLRPEELRLLGLEVKYRLPGGMEEFSCERQQIGCPGPDRHHNQVTGNSLSIMRHDSTHAIIVFIQLSKPDALTHLNAQRFGLPN